MLKTLSTALFTLLLGTLCLFSTASADESKQRYGVELRGGFGMYDLGDIVSGREYIQNERAGNTLTSSDGGPTGGLSGLFRPTKHSLWEFGYNALLDVDNTVENSFSDTASGQILMHANEFFLKGSGVILLTDRIHLDLGAGVSYYNVELQIQDDFGRRYNYDAVGRCWGLLGSGNLEFLLTDRFGLALGGGARVANATDFSQEASIGVRSILPVIGGSRPMEVNMSGAYGQLGLRFYFDKVTKPIDFSR